MSAAVDVLAVRIEPITLPGETAPTYFIDLIKGRDARNIRSTKCSGEAKRIAAEIAAANNARTLP